MNPQVVWHVWRRIMREPELQNALFSPDEHARSLDRFGFTQDECDAAWAYARQGDRAKWFVTNYRFRLTNSFLNALETGAPLTLRALLGRGADIPALSRAFLDRHAWKDYGPYVHAYCLDALRFLSEQPDVMAIEGGGGADRVRAGYGDVADRTWRRADTGRSRRANSRRYRAHAVCTLSPLQGTPVGVATRQGSARQDAT
ncbi:hypothetical protein PSAC2689_10583 [Paraburkholderia sacchari]